MLARAVFARAAAMAPCVPTTARAVAASATPALAAGVGTAAPRRWQSTEHTLVLMRHGQSTWNLENRFTGWVDVPLTEQGNNEARNAGKEIKAAGLEFDIAYTSVLKRAIRTLWHVLEETDQMWLPVIRDYRLNERHYGALSGLNKAETQAEHGEEKVLLWRRSYDVPPPALDESNEYYPGHDRRYAHLSKAELPLTESLKITGERVLPYWTSEIAPTIKAGKRVLIAAHGNSLRALVKHLDDISDDEITGLNIPTGVPLVYKLNADLRPIRSEGQQGLLSGQYLGDQDAIAAAAAAVANQTKG